LVVARMLPGVSMIIGVVVLAAGVVVFGLLPLMGVVELD
jgi:hypothetical protein